MSDAGAVNRPESQVSTRTLVRAVGLAGLTAISLNGVIGSGIFVLPATVASLLGPAAPLAYVVAAVVMTLIVLCFAEAGSMYERTGGPYLYARDAFGAFIGFEVGWMFLITRLVATAAIGAALTNYLGYFWPPLASGFGRIAAVTITIAGLGWMNFIGVRHGARVVNVLTIAKLIPLSIFIGVGLFFINSQAFRFEASLQNLNLRQASLALIFAFGGFENASVPAEEVRDPRRNLPIALLVSMVATTAIYILIQLVAQGTLTGLAGDRTPIASSATIFLGPAGGTFISVGALVSCLGSISAVALVGPRILFAFAEGKQLPSVLARIHPTYSTPHVAIAVFAAAVWLIALYGEFSTLAAVSAMARLLFSAATCLAVPVLRRRLPDKRREFVLKGGSIIPVIAAAISIWLLTGIDRIQAVSGAAALAIGALIYALSRWRSRDGDDRTRVVI